MSRMSILRSGVLAAALAACWTASAQAQAAGGAPIPVGVGIALTGPIAASGEQFRRGVALGAELANAEGGVHGRPIEPIVEDTKFEATLAVNAFRKLVNVDGVQTVIFGGSSPLTAIAPLATQDKVVVVNLGAQSPALAGISPYVFHAIQLANYDIEVISSYVYETLGKRRMALMYVNNDTGVSNKETMDKYFTALGGTIVESTAFNQADVNFGAQIARVRAADPDVIYLSGTTAEHPFLVKQLRDAGVTAQLISYVAAESPEMIQIAAKEAEGLIYTASHFNVNSDAPDVKKFVEAYRARYNQNPGTRDAIGYDSMYLAVAVMRAAAPDATGEELRRVAMEVRRFPAVTGEVLLRDDGTVGKTIDLKIIRDGKFEVLATIEPKD